MKRKFARGLLVAALTVMALGASMPAEATSIGLTGYVYSAGPTPFDIVLSTPLSGLATFGAAPYNGLLTTDLGLGVQLGTFVFDSDADSYDSLTFGFVDGSLTNVALALGVGSGGWKLDITFDQLGDVNWYGLKSLTGITEVQGGISPVPVPGTLILLITGAALLVAAGRLRAWPF